MKSIMLTVLIFFLGDALATTPVPPVPTSPSKGYFQRMKWKHSSSKILRSPKDQGNQPVQVLLSIPAPKATYKALPAIGMPLYFVNYGPGTAQASTVVSGTNMLLLVPAKAPTLYIPNKTQAPWAMLQSSPTLRGPWTTLGYFTNCVNGFNIVDVTATNQPMYFYRLVPQ